MSAPSRPGTGGDERPFAVGDTVRIRDLPITGHQRVPLYVRGAVGVVERVCGPYPNPESLGHGGNGLPVRILARVRIPQRDLWADYAGNAADTLDIEIYEHWLERVA
ncbi:MAG: SH3-like domain-containing protein [Pseudomonadota bacterium]